MADEIPDALGDNGRAESVLSVLANLQREELELELRRTATDAGEQDTFAVRLGEPVTFKQEKRRLNQAARRIAQDHRDIMPRVRKEIERRREAEKEPG